jgi:hypothetical protein
MNMAPALPPDLVEKVVLLIRALLDREENTEIYRPLLKLALDWGVHPERYRSLLVTLGMSEPRASELKIVLSSRRARRPFLRKKLSWKKALKIARDEHADPNRLTLLARRLARSVFADGGDSGTSVADDGQPARWVVMPQVTRYVCKLRRAGGGTLTISWLKVADAIDLVEKDAA